MERNKTSISAGEIIREALLASDSVTAITEHIFPVVANVAELPYISYRRSDFEHIPVKTGRGSDAVTIEVACYASSYGESITLAEAVRSALDHKQGEAAGMVMRSCTLIGPSEELWESDAFIQILNFKINI